MATLIRILLEVNPDEEVQTYISGKISEGMLDKKVYNPTDFVKVSVAWRLVQVGNSMWLRPWAM